jgi:formylglycine-generating enzyme required for sulfatase activity
MMKLIKWSKQPKPRRFLKPARFALLAVLLLLPSISFSNNLQISNLQVNANHKLTFTVSWENSWKLEGITAPYNHDAVWIFLKYKDTYGSWQHLDLSPDVSEHQSDSLDIETVQDGKGVFLKRKSTGSGNIDSASVTLTWRTRYLSGNYHFKVFGIEMSWIPEGSFYIGDGASVNALRRGDKNLPYYINSENSIKTGQDSLSLIDTGASAPGGDIPQNYPKGYHEFYCMKYEITQEQYADFLNTLTFIQQKAHVSTSPDAPAGSFAFASVRSNRNGITIQTPGKSSSQAAVFACDASGGSVMNNIADGQNRACNFLNWNDLAAYLQWTALRPMTELEFEKTCRGPLSPVSREFAWGTGFALNAKTVLNDGTSSEKVKENPGKDTGLASFGYTSPTGPLRAGFAANQNSDRVSAGSGYYGNMEMSGNLWEICIMLNKTGLLYTGITGDGNLPVDGFANIQGWPATDCNGAGYRGGGWNSGVSGQFRDLAVSDRFYIGLLPTDRRNTGGGRGVR